MNLFHKSINSPFRYPFTISQNRTKTHQPAIIVALGLGNLIGWGEAPAITYYNVTIEKMEADLQSKSAMIEKFALTDPERYWHYLHHLIPEDPFLVCALDIAAWDLFGKMENKPLYQLWHTQWENMPLTDYTIGIDTPEKMVEKLRQNPWPVYKIKLGTPQDIAIVKALRAETDVPFRIDANAGWTTEEALEKIPQLADLGVELIEQPLAKDNWDGMKKLFASSPIPLIADESCVFEQDVEKCYQHFHGINIKLTKCSGITPARRMIATARNLGMKVMMGSMNETSIGSAAVANFLPQLDYVDVDGPILLSEDTATGMTIKDGVVGLLDQSGLGIEVRI